MTLTLLLDLDDTLLNTHVHTFVPAYFQALARELTPHLDQNIIFGALINGMRVMDSSRDPSLTLEKTFMRDFYNQIHAHEEEMRPAIERFYDEIFPTLEGLTSKIESAKPFVDWALESGFRIAIATDPLLPRKATLHRLRWAGFDPDQFALITTWDRFHFSKSHPAYYAETLAQLGWPEGPVLMVGNDYERDIIPAKKLGLATYWVDVGPASNPAPEADARGDLQNLRSWLESTDHAALIPSFKTKEAVTAILESTPAALSIVTCGLQEEQWHAAQGEDDWCITEVACHLRDTEREIHKTQFDLYQKNDNPFIPRPDTGVWARERDYAHEDGATALKEFMQVRAENLAMLAGMPQEYWERKGRHAIFGPTTLLECAAFAADHDRMHVQQAAKLLKK